MRRICSSTTEAALQSMGRPQTSRRKRSRIAVPCGVCTTSGWNWMPYSPRSTSSSAATGDWSEEPRAVKPGGGSYTVSPWLIQQLCSAGSPASSRPGSWTVRVERPYSPTSAARTSPPSVSTIACMP